MRASRRHPLSKLVKATVSASTPETESDLLLHDKVYRRLRWLVVTGAWAFGTKLPGSRTLASQLAVSRNTVLHALDRLIADGWIEARRNSGMYVTYVGPQLASPSRIVGPTPMAAPLSPRAHAIDLFPRSLWNKLQSRRWKHLSSASLALGDPLGWRPLREAIAAHVAIVRNIECGPENIAVTTSVPAAIDLAIRALDLSGTEAWIEDPGYPPFKQCLRNCRVRAAPIPVDDCGIDVSQGVRLAPRARLAIVTPTCQFPTCAVMPSARRNELVAWASANGAWIIEDDYDWQSTDWRRGPNPLAAVDKIRTIYVNSFSPLLFPALRLAFAVIPSPLLDRFSTVRVGVDENTNVPNQMILADFMNGGHFDEHLRRLADAYPERRAMLVNRLENELPCIVTPHRTDIGTQIIASLKEHRERQFVDLCAHRGIVVREMTNFRLAPPEADEILLGFAGFVPSKIAAAVGAIRKAVNAA